MASLCACAEVHVSGRVTSDTGAPVEGAVITVAGSRAFSDPTGAFSLTLPSPGQYTLDAEKAGFFAQKAVTIDLSDGENEAKLTLVPVREFADTVDVQAAVTAIELDTTHPQETLTGAQILDIPYPSTHDLKNSMRAVPGVVQDSRGGVHIAGGSEEQALYLLDGFNVGDPVTGKFNTRISVEAVQAMHVESGRYPAEFGKASAGVVEVDTKTGDDRIRYSATNFVPGVEFQKGLRVGSWNPRFNVSGPVKRGRMWFSDSFGGQYDQTVIDELPPGQDTSTSLRYTNFARIQANLTPSNILSGGFLATSWAVNRNGLGVLDPPPTTVDRRQRQWFGYVRDQVYLGEGALIEFGVAVNRTFNRLTPQGHDLYIFTPNGREGNYYINGTQDAGRDQFLTNAFLPSFRLAGTHQLKAGIDLDRISYGQDLSRTGYEYLSSDMTPVRRVVYEGNGILARSGYETSAYVQDAWRVREDVLVEAGVRWDWDNLVRNWNTSPRFGVAWSPKFVRDTKLSGGFGIMYDPANLTLFTRPMDQYPVTYLYGPLDPAGVPLRSTFFNPGGNFSSPRYMNVSAAVDHRFGRSLYGRVEFMRRRGTRGLSYFWSPLSTWQDTVYALGNGRSDSYTSGTLTLRQTLRGEYGWLAGYTRSNARSNVIVDVAADDPQMVVSNVGPMSWDAPHRFIGWAYLPTPWKNWAIANLTEYHTGFPFSVNNDAGAILGGPNAYRYPDFLEINLHLERMFNFHGQRWAVRGGCNNVTNHQNPNTVINNIDSPQFLSYYGGQHRAYVFRIRWLGKI